MKIIIFILFSMSLIIISCKKDKSDYVEYSNLNMNLYLPDSIGDSVYVADPDVIKVGNTYYLYGTHTSKNFEVWYSENLNDWKYGGVIWKPTTGSWNDKPSCWAPDIEVTDSGYYMYYSVNGKIGIAHSNSPLGSFIDIYNHPFVGGGYGKVGNGSYISGHDYDVNNNLDFLLDFEEYAIDAFVLKSSVNGKLYMYFAALEPFSVIKLIPMSDYKTLKDTIPITVLSTNLFSWEGFNREAPWVLENKGKTFLMYSGNFWFTNNYSIGVATAENPEEKFTRVSNNPILSKNSSNKLFGPGHNCVVKGKYNDLLMFYHTRDNSDEKSARLTRYMQLYFDEQNNLKLKF